MFKKIFVPIIILTLLIISQILVNAENKTEKLNEPVILKPIATNETQEDTMKGDITEGTLKAVADGNEVVCPLKHTDVKAEISGFISSVEVTQEFQNPLNKPIEAIYIFPLPHEAAVYAMEMKVGERTIVGLIKTKEEARAIYDKAKQEGNLTGLLEQERPNIFTQSVANIKPGDNIIVNIKYVEILAYDKGTYEFVFPMVVGPRYNPPSVKDSDKITPQYLKPGQRSGHDISLELKLNAGIPVKDIRSKSHEVILRTKGENEALIKIKPQDSIPNKDFIIQYDVAGEKPECAAITNGKNGNGYFTLMIQPKADYKADEITPKEMVFVLDCSGSMEGVPIETSKAVVRKCIEGMNPDDTFQIISFSMTASGLSKKPLANNKENIKKGIEYVNAMSGEGGTNMIEGIKAALAFPADPKRMRIVFFLTDGYIGNETEILAGIEKELGQARLFSLGVGSSVNRYLLDMMAEVGRGEVQYVKPNEDGIKVVDQFYERISKPYLTDIEINWKDLKVSDLYPKRIPDLFSAQPLFIFGRYTKPGKATIEVTGKVAGKKISLPVPVEFLENNPENQALTSIWARQKIKDLENKLFQRADEKIINQITALALEFKLMSAYTSFVTVEKSYKVDNKGQLETIMVPVEMPDSVSYEGVFGEDKGKKVNGAPPPPSVSPTTSLQLQSCKDEKEADVAGGYIDKVAVAKSISITSVKNDPSAFKVNTNFDFTEYLKKTDKSYIKVQIYRAGEMILELKSPSDISSDKEKNIINLIFPEGKNPFTEKGEYSIVIEVYNKDGILAARGADIIVP